MSTDPRGPAGPGGGGVDVGSGEDRHCTVCGACLPHPGAECPECGYLSEHQTTVVELENGDGDQWKQGPGKWREW